MKITVLKETPVRLKLNSTDRVGIVTPPTQTIVANLYPDYTGATEITPKLAEDTVLPTRETIVRTDITVREIPVFKTKNASGGYTIYVAERMDE